jgi:Ca2+-binding RTX toxin-like protein
MVDENRKKRSAKRRAPTVAIQDFVSADDIVVLDNAVFTGLAAGAFRTGAAAADASDRIIYSSTTGALLFDLDGLGGVAAVQFATLSGHPAITAADLS